MVSERGCLFFQKECECTNTLATNKEHAASDKPSQAKPASSAARSLVISAPAMLTAASCGAGTIETAVTSATEAAVVVVVVHIWMKIGTGPVEHRCPRHASHIYGGRGDALGAPLESRGPQRRRHHLGSRSGSFRAREPVMPHLLPTGAPPVPAYVGCVSDSGRNQVP